MRAILRVALVVAAVAAVAVSAPRVASAQLEFPGFNAEGAVEAGVRFMPGGKPDQKDRLKFDEYRDTHEGVFLQGLQFRLATPNEAYSFELFGSKWGQSDQDFAFGVGRLGLWDFNFGWDQTPHIYSTSMKTFFTETSPGFYSLPTPRPALRSWNNAPNHELGLQWDTAKVGFTVTPTPDTEFKFIYTRIGKDGEKPYSAVFNTSPGGNFVNFPERIDEVIHDFRLQGAIQRERWQLQGGYTLSVYDNSIRAAGVDNPCFGISAALSPASSPVSGCGSQSTGAPTAGIMSVPPSNSAHTWSLGGGLNLPFWNTRLTANGSYSLRFQDQAFLGYSANPALYPSPLLAQPGKSLDGMVATTLFNINAVTRPIRPLTVSLKYRYFDLNDKTPELVVHQAGPVNDRATSGTDDLEKAPRFDYTRQNVDLDAKWRFNSMLATTLGGAFEHWDRINREAEKTEEWFGKFVIDFTPADWLLAHVTYRPSIKRVGYYNTFIAEEAKEVVEAEDTAELAAELNRGQSGLARKYDEADRDRQRIDVLLQVIPFETLSTTFMGGYRYDDYLHSTLGLQKETSWTAGMDVTWTPFERVKMTAGYVYENIFQKQASRSRPVVVIDGEEQAFDFPDFGWISNNTDEVNTFHWGVVTQILPKKLDWTFGGNYSQATGRVQTRNTDGPLRSSVAPSTGFTATTNPLTQQASAIAKRWPTFEDNLLRIETSLRYHFLKSWTISLAYVFESFDKTDWRETADPFIPGNTQFPGTDSIFLGNKTGNYDAHIVALTLGYRFGK